MRGQGVGGRCKRKTWRNAWRSGCRSARRIQVQAAPPIRGITESHFRMAARPAGAVWAPATAARNSILVKVIHDRFGLSRTEGTGMAA
jgi:hypothetical protein